ncbi:MAG: hypothetical protein QOD37_916 [Gaiellales bacterium]|nr:hypothetical protein [Gaiellales bacterium]
MTRDRNQLAFVAAISLVALAWLPGTLLSDVRGLRDNRRLSSTQAEDARGPSAAAGGDLALVRAARSRIPRGLSFAIERGGRWGSERAPNRAVAFAWQAGQSWTQFELAPRIQVAPADASWILMRDTAPVGRVARSWQIGPDWLVQRR